MSEEVCRLSVVRKLYNVNFCISLIIRYVLNTKSLQTCISPIKQGIRSKHGEFLIDYPRTQQREDIELLLIMCRFITKLLLSLQFLMINEMNDNKNAFLRKHLTCPAHHIYFYFHPTAVTLISDYK